MDGVSWKGNVSRERHGGFSRLGESIRLLEGTRHLLF
jgi:hypothetical protein